MGILRINVRIFLGRSKKPLGEFNFDEGSLGKWTEVAEFIGKLTGRLR